MKILSFNVPGPPQGKARARFMRLGPHVKTYSPRGTTVYQDKVLVCYIERHPGLAAWPGPVSVLINAFFPLPAGVSKGDRMAMLEGRILPVKKPDADNIIKIVLDALNGRAWKDDVQVVSVYLSKQYFITPHLRVEIQCLE